MKQVVIMPGGFHPFHAGHYALYKQAQDAFPGADIYVAATNDTSSRPFPFALKEKLAKLAGVAPGHFVQVKSPFQAREITDQLDKENTQLIFVRSRKDANKPPQAGGVKKNGEPAYLQPLAGNEDNLLPMNQRAYMAYLPTVEFGPGMTSATEIRGAWPTLNEKRKTALVMSLYPRTQKNPKLAATVVKMLDTAIGGEELNEFAPGNGDDDKPTAEYEVYQCNPQDQFDWIGGPLMQTDDMSKAHGFAYFLWKKHPDKCFMIWQERSQGSRGGYGPEGSVLVPSKDELNEFAPDEGGESRKFIPWNEFVDQLKQILHKDFDCKESINTSVIKAKFVPYDPMEYGPTQIYSYFERRAGRKGANSVRGQIQVGKFMKGQSGLMTSYQLLKGTEFERYFDLTFDNLYKIANIIKGNTEGRLQMPQPVKEDYIVEKK